MRMKRWESPRREGRNHKGKKNSARQRQIKKQTQVWRKKLKGDDGQQNTPPKSGPMPLFFCGSGGASYLSVSYHGEISRDILVLAK
jgi:hypothetical protein